MRLKLGVLLALVALALAVGGAGEGAAPRHAYYLFLAGAPRGCEDCYVPVLILTSSLEEVAVSGRDATAVVITTYERDSIWKVERNVSLAAADVARAERIVRLRGQRYRYQEIAPGEVLRLLEKPEGSIPIHRLLPAPSTESLHDLISEFRQGR